MPSLSDAIDSALFRSGETDADADADGTQMRIAIAGAGDVGRSIGRELVGNGHHVLLIDKDPELDHAKVPEAEWLTADACELTSLEEVSLQDYDVVVAATSDDKVNLVVSLLAKTEFAVGRVVARVNDPRNEWLFGEPWGVDVAVSTPRLIVAAVEEALAVGDIVELLNLRGGRAALVSFTMPHSTPLAGRAVARLSLPVDSSLVSILRGSRVIVPEDDDTFEPGDELLFIVGTHALPSLRELLLDENTGGPRR